MAIRFKVGGTVKLTDRAGTKVVGTVAIVVVRARLVAIQFPGRPDPVWFNFSDFAKAPA